MKQASGSSQSRRTVAFTAPQRLHFFTNAGTKRVPIIDLRVENSFISRIVNPDLRRNA
jgi:hypothetical protein